jgi:predicted aldo/keto reductase-like oxidoreductase
MENVSAALDRSKISTRDLQMLQQYAVVSSSSYCSGCAHICESAINDQIPISKVMRCLMYWVSYGDRERAALLFHGIPKSRIRIMATCDYTPAEQKCPQRMAIGKLMRTAMKEFI